MKNISIIMILFLICLMVIPEVSAQQRIKGKKQNSNPKEHQEEMEKLSPEQRDQVRKIMEMNQAYERLSKISEDKGEFEKAITYIEEILKLSEKANSIFPESRKEKVVEAFAHLNLRIAMLKTKLGKEDEAKAIVDKLLSEKKIPEAMLPGVYLRMSKFYEKNGNLDKAEELLLKSIEINKK